MKRMLASLFVLSIASAAYAQTVVLPQTPPPVQDGTARLIGRENPELKLHLVIGLRPPHMAEEEAFNAQHGQPLSAEEWNARFAPSAGDEAAVVNWLEGQGLEVTGRYPNRLIVDVSGDAATVEKAFHVSINRYRFGDENVYSNDHDPAIPAPLGHIVQSIGGLNDIQRMHSNNMR